MSQVQREGEVLRCVFGACQGLQTADGEYCDSHAGVRYNGAKIAIIELGWYHPSSANWSYHIHMIIDSTGARLYREVFGGDSRLESSLNEMGAKVSRLHAGKGSGVEYKWRDVKDLPDIESYSINWSGK